MKHPVFIFVICLIFSCKSGYEKSMEEYKTLGERKKEWDDKALSAVKAIDVLMPEDTLSKSQLYTLISQAHDSSKAISQRMAEIKAEVIDKY